MIPKGVVVSDFLMAERAPWPGGKYNMATLMKPRASSLLAVAKAGINSQARKSLLKVRKQVCVRLGPVCWMKSLIIVLEWV